MALPSHAVQQVLHLPMETPNEDDGHWSGRISESQGSIEIIGRLPGAPSSNPEGPSGPQATRPQASNPSPQASGPASVPVGSRPAGSQSVVVDFEILGECDVGTRGAADSPCFDVGAEQIHVPEDDDAPDDPAPPGARHTRGSLGSRTGHSGPGIHQCPDRPGAVGAATRPGLAPGQSAGDRAHRTPGPGVLHHVVGPAGPDPGAGCLLLLGLW